MEKLLLKFLLEGSLDINTVKLEFATNEQFFKVLKRLHLYNKKKPGLMLESDLLLVMKSELNNVEYRKVEAYIQASKDFPTELSPKEVLQEAKVAQLLREAESTLSEVADAGIAKDKDLMLSKTKDLYEIVQASQEKTSVVMGEDIEENLFFLDSFSESLNEITTGLSGLTIIGGMSGSGKSFYSIQEVIKQWHDGNSSLFFSLEMPAALLEARIMSAASGINLTALIKSKLTGPRRVPLSSEDSATEVSWKRKFKNAKHKIYIIDDTYNMNEISANIMSYSVNHGIKLVVIDYINLASSGRTGDAWVAISSWVKDLNQLAIQRGLVILSPTQITVTENPDGSLGMTTRGSSELMNSASLALLLYRNEETKAAGLVALHVTKTRNGEKAVIALADELKIASFKDVGVLEKG